MAVEVAGDEVSSMVRSKKKLTFLDLPVEAQKEIISHCSQSDLICLALVSKHFHALASAQLYRSFNIIFPDDDDISFESPIDGLAGGLDTFTTSEYNYAKHLKDLSMDTLSTGTKAEHAYKSYLYSASCGKFLNTLLYLMLKKAKALESFRWNIRVELSRQVFAELHKIKSLRKLQIRMQAGESYYNTPPPLPVSLGAPPGPMPIPNHWTEIPPPPPAPLPINPWAAEPVPIPDNPPTYSNPDGSLSALTAPSKQAAKNKASRLGNANGEPPTLSGFKKLTTLSVLDIDNLDVINELKACVKNSSSTLKELNLSLSDSLASQARKPQAADSDPDDDSDVEDEFAAASPSPGGNQDGSGPAKVFRAQEERKIQEAILGKILDAEPLITKKPQISKGSPDSITNRGKGKGKGKEKEIEDAFENPREGFVSSLRGVSNKLMSLLNGSRDFSASQQEILDVIEKAARKYIDSGDLPSGAGDDAANQETQSSTAKEKQPDITNPDTSTPETPSAVADPPVDPTPEEDVMETIASLSIAEPAKRRAKESCPEDIDIAHLDTEVDAFEDSDGQLIKDKVDSKVEDPSTEQVPSGMDHLASPKMTSALLDTSLLLGEDRPPSFAAPRMEFESIMSKLRDFQDQADSLGQQIKDMLEGPDTNIDHVEKAEARLSQLFRWSNDIQYQIKMMEHEMKNSGQRKASSTTTISSEMERKQRCIDDYLRNTRGLSLETLNIYLIPVKASVLSRAIDFSSIRNLTLLNVGNQVPIWTLLSKENKTRPLALRNVFTDNVSNAFLTCMSQLTELHELFMLERTAKHKPESFAPKSTIKIDQIRRLVLKKHIMTLKRLMIKDETSSSNWDVNQKAMILICNRGAQLEELAVSMNIHAVHAFMQYFAGLINLRAINILRFRNNDTCIWVMREILKFIVDNLSHHPELKLEWIAMEDDRIDRVIRPSDDIVDQEDSTRTRGNDATSVLGSGHSTSSLPALPTSGWASGSETSDDEDDEDRGYDNGKRLRLKTVGPLQFYDVWGVKIFEKEIRNGRL